MKIPFVCLAACLAVTAFTSLRADDAPQLATFSMTLAPAATFPGPNLVTNPSFEATPLGTGYTFTNSSDPDFGVSTGNAHTGTHSVDYAGGTPTSLDTVSQSISTVAGATYNVSFYLTNLGISNPSNRFLVTFGGATVYDKSNQGGFGYTQFSANITVTGTSTVLSFGGYNGTSEFNLDDVSVNQVPEPSTWALLGVGVLGAGVTMRRRRRAIA